MGKKRVWTLYRVSTKAQVNVDDDIPLQKNACRKMIADNANWELTYELYERGVSGWKKGINERDALNEIRIAAIDKEFDILLVFMFDRLGRKEDETPLVVDFLHQQGIEVISVNEGKMSVGEYYDRLLNYITFWQSSDESLKTSIRVKEQMRQLNEKGYFVGGKIPFGYKLIETPERHWKNKDKFQKRIIIDEEEAMIVKIIFDVCINKNYGRHKIAQYLNTHGYKNRGNPFTDKSVYRILENPIYIGRKRYNTSKTLDQKRVEVQKRDWKTQPYNALLRIIDDEEFDMAQNVMNIRRNKMKMENQKFHDGTPNSSKVLLSGILKCGYCGGKMKTDYS